jgi:hypothetical protein
VALGRCKQRSKPKHGSPENRRSTPFIFKPKANCMPTNNKRIVITIAAALIAAFFMPWLTFFVSLSAWDMIFGAAGQYIDTALKYIVVVIPLTGALIVYGTAFNNEEYPISKGLLFRLPLCTLIVITIAIAFKISAGGGQAGSSGLENILKAFGIGFWLTLIGSIILPFNLTPSRTGKVLIKQKAYPPVSKAGIAIAAVGLLFVTLSTQNQLFTKTYKSRVDGGAYGLPDAYNPMGPVYDSQTYVDTKAKDAFLYAGLVGLILGGLFFAAGRSSTHSLVGETGDVSENKEGPQSAASITATDLRRPQVHIKFPRVNWDKTLSGSKHFLSKYKVALLTGAIALAAFIAAYNVFIKADPVRDGKSLAKIYCACSDDLNKGNLASMKFFYDGFEKRRFKSRMEARNSFSNLQQENLVKYNSCTQAADMKYKEKFADYNSSGGKNLYTLEQTYRSLISSCVGSKNAEVIAFQGKVDEKIRAIVDPEPDVTKIKSDIIGQQIPGWTFSYLNEFTDAQILDIARSADRLEYQMKFDLVDNSANSKHECQAVVVYLQNEDGWYMNNVSMNYITYSYTLYPDRYVQITPLQGCGWQAENKYKMSWKTSNWDFAGETITGPDQGAASLPSSSVYFLKSLEDKVIDVKFTYRPAN